MGLFSGKDVTTVGTQVQRVLEDKAVPNSLASGLAKNLFADDDQMIEHVLDELANSVGLRANQMLAYGRRTYQYGLPRATFKSSAAGRGAAEAAIEAMLGMQVAISYYHYGPYNNLHLGWQRLVEDHGYDSSTNRLANLSALKGTPVYLQDLQAVVTDATLEELANGSMDQWGPAANTGYTPARPYSTGLGTIAKPTPFAVDPQATQDYVRADYCWEVLETVQVDGKPVEKKVLHSDRLIIPITGFDGQADYHQARYIANGKAGYWTYRAGAGTQPAVDAVFETTYNTGGTFFPITYFRHNKTSGTADLNSAWYKQSSKLVDYLGMDYKVITDAIHENPDIANVEQAMMVFAVPANTTNPLEQRYLFDFFSGLHDEVSNAMSGDLLQENALLSRFPELTANLYGNPQNGASIIQDGRSKMALSYSNINRRKVAGSIGEPGTHASGFGTIDSSATVPVIGGGNTTWDTKTKVHWYRRQISDSVYEEITVRGLQMKYWVFENYTTTGDEDDEILLIPLDNAITLHYSAPDRETLYARSLHYVFNSRIITHLKWYQTGWFAAVLTIIAVVITILAFGPEVGAVISAAIAGTLTWAIVEALLIKILVSIVVSKAIALFVRKIGAKFALILAVVLAIAGMYQQFADEPVKWLPKAKDLLAASSNLSAGAEKKLQSDFGDLLTERTDFENYVKEQTKTLEKVEDLLDSSLNLSPLVIFGESPQDFYRRTVHSGNIGIVGIDVVGSYVDIALQLPKINDTLGGSV